MLSASDRHRKIGAIVRVASCNFIEAYDFFVYGYYAGYIADTFFPGESEFLRLMQSLLTFGVGYLVRPLGAILLGAYMDRKGRKKGLILTLGLMAIGTLSIAVTPGFATIGWLAPLIIIAGRLLQGLSAGAEFGGVAIYLSEIATPGRHGFYCSWQAVSQQVAVVFAAAIGFLLSATLTPAEMTAWGWRLPLLAGIVALPLILWLRSSLEETEAFVHSRHVRAISEVLKIMAANWPLIACGMALTAMTTTSFYLITAYTPTYARTVLQFSAQQSLLVTLLVGLSNLFWLPIGGILTDRFGARSVMLGVTIATLVTAYPAMAWLVSDPGVPRLLAVLLLFSLYFGLYNGALIPLLAEIMPREIRTTAFSFAFVTATAVFGGFTPAVAAALVQSTGNGAAPALWLSLAAAVSLVAAVLLPIVPLAGARTKPAPAALG